jgi:multiple sugar transport system permease protein
MKKAGKRRLLGRDTAAALGFLSPSFGGLLIFVVVPIIGAAVISLFEWDILTPPRYVGAANYAQIWDELARGNVLRQVFANTLYFTVGTVPLAMVVSLGVALLLNRKILGVAAFRAIYFLPTVTSVVALSIIWRLMYNPDYGLVNRLLALVHLPGPGWLADPRWSMPAIIIMSVWSGIGYNAILYLAGMQGIAATYYEAARIDGAGAWQQFRHITWPLLSPTTHFIFTMSIIAGFQVFTQIFMMTSGRPTPETQVYVYHVYSQAFTSFKMGYASALACVLFLVILSVTLVQFRMTRRWVHYG